MRRRRRNAAASPVVLEAQRPTVWVRGPGTRFEARVSHCLGAEELLGKREPGTQTLR
jgi:hypothetical protein